MENLTRTLADAVIAATYVPLSEKVKKKIKAPKVATTEPIATTTRQQLRASDRKRAKLARHVLAARAGRSFDQKVAAE